MTANGQLGGLRSPWRSRVLGHVAAVVLTVLASSGAASGQALPPGRSHEPARIIVKLADHVDVCLDRAARLGGSLDAAIPGSALGKINARFGARDVRPLRAVDRSGASMAARRANEQARRLHRGQGRSLAAAARLARAPSFVSTYVLDLAPDVDVHEAARAYAADPAVDYAQPDWLRRTTALTDDPFASSMGSWAQPFADLWGHHLISAPDAWDTARGAGVVIAISDTGIDTTHPDLAANVWVNPGEIAGNGVDDDANGYVDDVNGWSFVTGSNDVADDHGHGTHVAGTAAAIGNNGLGIAGVAYESKVMAVKGLAASGSGSDSALADGLLYALENGADVVNASWGGAGESPVLDAAIDALAAAGVVFAAAAGNSAVDVDLSPYGKLYPASHPHAIAVAAFDHQDQPASFSNFGAKIDLAAPGGGGGAPPATYPERSILSLLAAGAGAAITFDGNLVVGGGYLRQAGTSMASPHVAGAAAVILSAHPDWDPELVRSALRAGADDVGAPGWDIQSGHGRLNVAAALSAAPLASRITAPAIGTLVSGNTLAVLGSAYGPTFASYTVDYALVDDPTSWTTIAGPVSVPVTGASLASASFAAWPDGEIYVRLRTSGTDGAVFEDRTRVTLDRVAITSPWRFDVVNDAVVEITGSVHPGNLQSYTVEYNLAPEQPDGAWSSAGISLPGGGTSPIESGVIALLDTSALPGATHIAFRVRAETTTGTIEERVIDVVVDTAVREGWPFKTGYEQWFSYSPNVADVDGDGQKEILLAVVGYLGVLRADGSYAPGWPQQLWNGPLSHGFIGNAQPAVADMDGDGTLEIAITTKGLVFLYRHDGTLVDGWPVAYGLEDTDIVFADVDQDSLPEILTIVDHGGAWGLQQAELLALNMDGTPVSGFPLSLAPGEWNPHMAVGDTTGDGIPEIAITYWKPRYQRPGAMYGYLLDLAGNPLWKRPVRFGAVPWKEPYVYTRWILPTPPAMADVDGDGVLDVIFTPNSPGPLRAYRGDRKRARGRLGMKLPKFKSDRGEDRSEPIAVGDLTGDGLPEIVYATHLSPDPRATTAPGGTDYLVAIDPTAGQMPGWPLAFPFHRTGGKIYGLGRASIGDVDGDGRQEVVIAVNHCKPYNALGFFNRRCDSVHAYEADGTPVAGFPRPTTYRPPYGDAQIAIDDLEGDGQVELIWVDGAGQIIVWTIPGAGTPAPHAWPMLRRDPQHTGALPAAP